MGKVVVAYVVIIFVLVMLGVSPGWAFVIPIIGIAVLVGIVAFFQNNIKKSESTAYYAERFSTSETVTLDPIVKKHISSNKMVKSFIAIDFETATSARSSACAMAMVVVKDSEIIEEYKLLIQPPNNEYSAINSRVHGIKAIDTKNQPTIENYYQEIFDMLDSADVVAHNASFDLSVLDSSLEYYGLNPPRPHSISCTYRMTGLPLSSCCDQYDIELDHHDPLSDARACATLFIQLSNNGVVMPKPAKRKHNTINLRRETLSSEVVANKETRFYGKNVVITGVFESHDRVEIADAVQALGASVKSSISAKTDILICGNDCGPAKLAKVFELREQGVKDIEILREEDLVNCDNLFQR